MNDETLPSWLKEKKKEKIEPKPLEKCFLPCPRTEQDIRSALEWITEMEEQRLRLLKSENRNQFQEGYFAAIMVCKKLRSKAFAAVKK